MGFWSWLQVNRHAMHTDASSCPRCGYRNYISRSRHRNIEKLMLSILQLKPYRCRACGCRFYARDSAKLTENNSSTHAFSHGRSQHGSSRP